MSTIASDSSPPSSATKIPRSTHLHHLQSTISLALQSPPQPTNFRVGCVIVSYPPTSTSESEKGTVLSTGYTLELEGNTHAEQNALAKLSPAQPQHTSTASSVNILYTSLEPCGKRLSGATPCVYRILEHQTPKIHRVVFGAKEPGTFVQDSQSCRVMSERGLEWEYLPEFEGEILRVAMAGHVQGEKTKGTNVDDITPEERRRQEALPRNPKKRMMEVPPPPPTSAVSASTSTTTTKESSNAGGGG